VTLHLRFFDGGNAVSDFKVQQFLPRLQGVSDKITGLSARFVHLASFDAVPDAATLERLGQLLTYGAPCTEAHLALEKAGAPALLVMPRLGTVSPWASKATDIATTAAWRCTGWSGWWSTALASRAACSARPA
jgi:phosphoribosylformylglycinamidine synthase